MTSGPPLRKGQGRCPIVRPSISAFNLTCFNRILTQSFLMVPCQMMKMVEIENSKLQNSLHFNSLGWTAPAGIPASGAAAPSCRSRGPSSALCPPRATGSLSWAERRTSRRRPQARSHNMRQVPQLFCIFTIDQFES